jgi:hypothetical protein
MRKGFFLTESERNRISNLYGGNKMFLLESTNPPTDPEEVKKFMDWADTKDPNWVVLKLNPKKTGTSKNSDGTPRKKVYGNPNSASYKKAWAASGETYMKEKGTGGSMAESQKKEFRYFKNDKWSSLLTKDEMEKAYEKGDFKGSDRVFKVGMTISNNSYPIACQVQGLDIPCDPITVDTGTTGDTKIKNTYQSKIGAQGLTKPKFSSPYDNISASTATDFINAINNNAGVNPYQSKYTHQFSNEGLKNYLAQIYGLNVPADTPIYLNSNDKSGTITIGNTKTTYYYDQKNNTWDLPQTQGNVEFIQPKTREEAPKAP